jgi:hypothetical protein
VLTPKRRGRSLGAHQAGGGLEAGEKADGPTSSSRANYEGGDAQMGDGKKAKWMSCRGAGWIYVIKCSTSHAASGKERQKRRQI